MADRGPVSIAVVGAGPWGQRLAATIDRLQETALAGIVSTALSSGRRDTAMETPVWPSVEAMLDQARPDGVALAVPPPVLEALAPIFLDRGIPVLAEKPLTLSAAGARGLVQQARARSTLLMVDLIYLFHPGFRALRKQVDGQAGPRKIHGVGGNAGPVRPAMPAFRDYGPHDISMALALLGPACAPVAVRKFRGDAWEHVIALTLGAPDGSSATLEFGNMFDRRRRTLAVETAAHRWVFDDGAGDMLTCDGAAVPVESGLPLDIAVREFAAATAAVDAGHETQNLAVRVNEILDWVGAEMEGRW